MLREEIALSTHLLEEQAKHISNSGGSDIKSGWLNKKGKPRWFLVVNDIVMWFEKEQVYKFFYFILIFLLFCYLFL